jgi:hypothetical protein
LLEGRRLREAAEGAHFDSPLHEPEFVKELQTVERMEFDGRSAHKVRVVLASGTERTEYFDVESGLLIGTEVSRETPLGIVPVMTVLRDYRRFGAISHPTVIIQRQLGIEQTARIDTFEYNVVPPDAFDLPPDVKALVQ